MRNNLIIIALTLLTIISCTKAEVKKSEISVAISPDFFPFSYIVSDSLAGLEIELLNLIEKRLKTTFVTHRFHHHNFLDSFNDSDIDMAIGGITVTDRRTQVFDFSQPYYNATQTFVGRADSPDVDSLAVITGSRIGVLNNSSSLFFLEDVLIKQGRFSTNNLRRYPTQKDLVDALEHNDISFILLEHSVAELIVAKHDLKILVTNEIEENYGIAFKKSSNVAKNVTRALQQVLRSEEWQIMKNVYLLEF